MTNSQGQVDEIRSRLNAAQEALRAGDIDRALGIAEDALASGIAPLNFLTLAAFCRIERGENEAALALASRARAIGPRNVDALVAMGTCLARLERPAEAVAVFDRAITQAPNDADLHLRIAAALETAKEYRRAAEEYERAFVLEPAHADAAARLAFLSSTRGDMKKARAAGLKALALDPRQAFASFAVALADIDEGNFDDARRRLLDVIDIPNIGRIARALAQNILGDALDGMGRTAEAFAAYEQSGEAMHALYAPPPGATGETALARSRRIAAFVAHTPAARWSSARRGSRVPCHAFLLSFPRSGTTLLTHVLAAHPKIATLDEKRTFADSLDLAASDGGLSRLAAMGEEELETYREAYWKRAAAGGFTGAQSVLVDKMPLNSEILCVIAKLFPEAKILFALRDPRDVVFSCFRRRFAVTRQNYELLTLQSTSTYYDATMSLSELYREKLALPFFDVRHEDLVSDFENQTKALCTILGVEPDPALANFAERARAQNIATPNAALIGRGIAPERKDQWRPYAQYMAPVMELLAPWVAKFGYGTD